MIREDSPWWAAGYTAEWWRALPLDERKAWLANFDDNDVEDFYRDWRVWGRDKQLAPELMPDGSKWRTWLVVAGRGFGKTRCMVEFVIDEVTSGRARRICVIGQGADDIRTVIVEGESGFLTCSNSTFMPIYYPTVGGGKLVWPNGAEAFLYSAEDPEALRGPQFDLAVFDEPMAVPADKRQKTVSNLRFGLRLGDNPRLVYTTTPKPHAWLREMLANADDPKKRIIVTRGSTYENADNLAESFIEGIMEDYDGTRLGKQEIYGELLGMEDGALWDDALLAKCRLLCDETDDGSWPSQLLVAFANACDKVVVSVDPNIKPGGTAHAAGILVIGKRGKERFVIADRTVKGGPSKWSLAAVDALIEFGADEIVAESNQGGEMVRIVINQAAEARSVQVKTFLTHASKGKQRRAEPAANAYERGLVFHLGKPGTRERPGPFYALEQQMTNLHDGGDPTGEDFDRADALVWGLTRLGLKRSSAGMTSHRGGFYTFEEMGPTNGETSGDWTSTPDAPTTGFSLILDA